MQKIRQNYPIYKESDNNAAMYCLCSSLRLWVQTNDKRNGICPPNQARLQLNAVH